MVIDDRSTRVTPSRHYRLSGACVTRYGVNMGYGRELVKACECAEIDGGWRFPDVKGDRPGVQDFSRSAIVWCPVTR